MRQQLSIKWIIKLSKNYEGSLNGLIKMVNMIIFCYLMIMMMRRVVFVMDFMIFLFITLEDNSISCRMLSMKYLVFIITITVIILLLLSVMMCFLVILLSALRMWSIMLILIWNIHYPYNYLYYYLYCYYDYLYCYYY